MSTKTAVLLMAYGTPRSSEEILPYYTDIRRGRPPTEEQLADLTARYDAIGGISPLAARTEAQQRVAQGTPRARVYEAITGNGATSPVYQNNGAQGGNEAPAADRVYTVRPAPRNPFQGGAMRAL